MAPLWMSIEVFDGAFAASSWQESFGDSLVESALGFGATDWSWDRHTWGVIFEVAFEDEASWEKFRASLPVQTALDAVPDPVSGLIVYKGRGGSAGRSQPRKPKPLSGSGAASLPMPELLDEDFIEQIFRDALERRVLSLAG